MLAGQPEGGARRTAVGAVGLGLFVFTALDTASIPILPAFITDRLCLEDVYTFFFFACRPFVQLILSPVVGHLVDVQGPLPVILGGLAALLLSGVAFGVTLTLADAQHEICAAPGGTSESGSGGSGTLGWGWYFGLVATRAAQGGCGAAIMSGGLALVAGCHRDDERGEAMGGAMLGLAAGALVPLVSGWLAQAAGPGFPFFLLGGLVALDALLFLSLCGRVPSLASPEGADPAAVHGSRALEVQRDAASDAARDAAKEIWICTPAPYLATSSSCPSPLLVTGHSRIPKRLQAVSNGFNALTPRRTRSCRSSRLARWRYERPAPARCSWLVQ